MKSHFPIGLNPHSTRPPHYDHRIFVEPDEDGVGFRVNYYGIGGTWQRGGIRTITHAVEVAMAALEFYGSNGELAKFEFVIEGVVR